MLQGESVQSDRERTRVMLDEIVHQSPRGPNRDASRNYASHPRQRLRQHQKQFTYHLFANGVHRLKIQTETFENERTRSQILKIKI